MIYKSRIKRFCWIIWANKLLLIHSMNTMKCYIKYPMGSIMQKTLHWPVLPPLLPSYLLWWIWSVDHFKKSSSTNKSIKDSLKIITFLYRSNVQNKIKSNSISCLNRNSPHSQETHSKMPKSTPVNNQQEDDHHNS